MFPQQAPVVWPHSDAASIVDTIVHTTNNLQRVTWCGEDSPRQQHSSSWVCLHWSWEIISACTESYHMVDISVVHNMSITTSEKFKEIWRDFVIVRWIKFVYFLRSYFVLKVEHWVIVRRWSRETCVSADLFRLCFFQHFSESRSLILCVNKFTSGVWQAKQFNKLISLQIHEKPVCEAWLSSKQSLEDVPSDIRTIRIKKLNFNTWQQWMKSRRRRMRSLLSIGTSSASPSSVSSGTWQTTSSSTWTQSVCSTVKR